MQIMPHARKMPSAVNRLTYNKDETLMKDKKQ